MNAWSALLELFGASKRQPRSPKQSVPDTDEPDIPEEDDEEETQEQRDDRHKFLIVWFRRLREDVEYRVDQLTEMLAEGDLDSHSWSAAFQAELTKAHIEAFSIGRRLAGHVGPFEDGDQGAGVAAWARQEQFLQRFVSDLESGRYTKSVKQGSESGSENDSGSSEKELNEKAFGARARQYVASVRGTVHESFRQALGDDLTDWNLGSAEHCKPSEKYPFTCPELAKESPKPANEWQTAPARGDCPCGGECKCWMSTSDGKYSTEGI